MQSCEKKENLSVTMRILIKYKEKSIFFYFAFLSFVPFPIIFSSYFTIPIIYFAPYLYFWFLTPEKKMWYLHVCPIYFP